MSTRFDRRLWLTCLVVAAATAIAFLGPLTSLSHATNYYAGNKVTSSYGLKADIWTPAAPFDVDGSDFVPSWVSTCGFADPGGGLWYWTQAGYTYQPSEYPRCRSYYERHDINGNYYIGWMGDHSWGTSKNYQIFYFGAESGRGKWAILLNGVFQRYSYAWQTGPLEVQAYTETHSSLSNMNGIFRNVKKRSSTGTWSNLSSGLWRQDYPFYVNYTTYYNYNTAGGF